MEGPSEYIKVSKIVKEGGGGLVTHMRLKHSRVIDCLSTYCMKPLQNLVFLFLGNDLLVATLFIYCTEVKPPLEATEQHKNLIIAWLFS